MSARRFDPLVMFDVPKHGGGQTVAINGVDLFVDTVNGSDQRSGTSWDAPLATVGEAFTRLGTPRFYSLPGNRKGSNSRIFVIGDVREHAVAPLGVYGGRIIGAFGGRPRHVTNNGVVTDGNGASWRDTSVAGSAPLLDLIEQGWGVYNMMMIPPTGYDAIRLHREESATYPDASHAIISGNRFFGGSQVGLAIDDYGATSHALIADNEFEDLEFGYKSGGVGISAPNRHNFIGNSFHDCKNDICGNFYGTRIEDNRFRTVYHATTHPNTVNNAYTADSGLAANSNQVLNNFFEDTSGNVTIAKGYKPATGDNWNNHVFGTAALIVAVPT